MGPVEQSMIIYWLVRYYAEADRRIKKRVLFLDTNAMPMDVRFPFMFRVEAEDLLSILELKNYRKFFIEVTDRNYHETLPARDWTSQISTEGNRYYYETESGEYFPEWEMRKLMGKESSSAKFPPYTNRYLEHEDNVEICFSSDELRQLQIFTENYEELKKNSLKSPSLVSPNPFYQVRFKNTEMELKAYVLNFRKIYSKDGQAGGSFPDLCEAIKTHTNTALANLAEDSLEYFNELNSTDIRSIPKKFIEKLGAPCIYKLLENYPSKVTVCELIQLFFYTQYHHNPHTGRVGKIQELKAFLHRRDANDILKYTFFMALLNFQELFFNTGQAFVGTFHVQAPHRNDSVKIPNLGEKGATTEDLRKRSKFETFKRSFAHALWIEADRPECGEYAFEEEAERRMLLALGRIYI